MTVGTSPLVKKVLKIIFSFFLNGTAFTPPPLLNGTAVDFFCGSHKLLCSEVQEQAEVSCKMALWVGSILPIYPNLH